MLSLGAYSFTNLMLAHHEAAVITGRQAQARSLVDSGVTAVQLFLSQGEADRIDAGGIYDNAEQFRGVVGRCKTTIRNDRGCFSVISPGIDSEGNSTAIRYGLEDESTRLNLNVLLILDKQVAGAGRTLLMASARHDRRRGRRDSRLARSRTTSRASWAAEVDYYRAFRLLMRRKNGPVDTVEELLLVRGVTPQLLFGCRQQPQRPTRSSTSCSKRTPASARPIRAPSAAGRPI